MSIIHNHWKQPNVLQWVNGCPFTVKYDLAMKEKLLLVGATSMSLKYTILSKGNQSQVIIYCMLPSM